jgi:chaperonin GroES
MPAQAHDDTHAEVKQAIRMTADRLLLAPSPETGDRKSRAGILIPATANVDRRLVWAEVVAAGPTVRNIEPTDRVLFSPDSGFEVEIRGEEYLILRERDVHAIASTRAEGQSGLYL